MKHKITKYFVTLSTIFLPLTTFAATGGTLSTLVGTIIKYLNVTLALMMGFAIVMFTFYVIKYYVMPNEDRKVGNIYVMYSIIGFFVILSFWGLVNIVQNSFGLGNQTPGSWDSFTNIFPGGGTSNDYNPATNTGTNFGTP